MSAHVGGQMLTLEGKIRSLGRAFTSCHARAGRIARRRVLGKYPTKWTDLARKRGTLPSILDTGTNFSRKAAPHLASFIDVL